MNNIQRIQLPINVLDYLQRLAYEVNGMTVLHTHAVNAGVDTEKCQKIKHEFQELYNEYQLAQNEVFSLYSPVADGIIRRWIDFQNEELCVVTTDGLEGDRNAEKS